MQRLIHLTLFTLLSLTLIGHPLNPPDSAILIEARTLSGTVLRDSINSAVVNKTGQLPKAWNIDRLTLTRPWGFHTWHAARGLEMLKPQAIAVIGTLTLSVLLSLIATPTVYFVTRTLGKNKLRAA